MKTAMIQNASNTIEGSLNSLESLNLTEEQKSIIEGMWELLEKMGDTLPDEEEELDYFDGAPDFSVHGKCIQ